MGPSLLLGEVDCDYEDANPATIHGYESLRNYFDDRKPDEQFCAKELGGGMDQGWIQVTCDPTRGNSIWMQSWVYYFFLYLFSCDFYTILTMVVGRRILLDR